MTTIKHLLCLICFGTFLLSAQKTTLSLEKSTLKWTGEQITSKTHYGSLQFKSGVAFFENGLITKGTFIVDMTTLSRNNIIFVKRFF